MSDGDMKLDMAPLKSPSPNRQQGIAYLIPQLDQALKGDLAAALKPHGLTVQQFTLLLKNEAAAWYKEKKAASIPPE